MAYVVTGACAGCKCGQCAEMCPVNAFREGEIMLLVDPNVCVDCGACRQHCLRGAIFSEEDLPQAWEDYVVINARESAACPTITEPQEPIGFPNWDCAVNRPQLNLDSEA